MEIYSNCITSHVKSSKAVNKSIEIRKSSCWHQSRMKQATLLLRALGFIVIVGCSNPKYLLVETDDGIDDEFMLKRSAGIYYSFRNI